MNESIIKTNIMDDADDICMTPEIQEEILRKLQEVEDNWENAKFYSIEEVAEHMKAAARGSMRHVQNRVS